MRHDDTKPAPSADTLAIPFLWVPEGETPSPEWLAAHPDWVRLEATFIPDAPPAADPALTRLAQLVMPGLGPGLVPPPSPPPLVSPRRQGAQREPDSADAVLWLSAKTLEFIRRLTAPSEQPSTGAVEMARPDRNDGLPPALQAQPQRYRQNLSEADEQIRTKYPDGNFSVHHLISVSAARSFLGLMEAAARAGWQMDESGNLMLLPMDERTREMMELGDLRPVHAGGHPIWTADVRRRLARIEADLGAIFGDTYGPERDWAAMSMLRTLEEVLRSEAMGKVRITLNEADAAAQGRAT